MSQHTFSSLIGTSLFLAGLEFAIASTEMSSRFSVENFSVDERTLQAAMNALCTYFIIAVIWTVACCLVLYSDYGLKGVIWGCITNIIFVGWIVVSYYLTFKSVSKNRNIPMPKPFKFSYSSSPLPRKIDGTV
jgi:hypothetical protein